jgi:hypothetical protein
MILKIDNKKKIASNIRHFFPLFALYCTKSVLKIIILNKMKFFLYFIRSVEQRGTNLHNKIGKILISYFCPRWKNLSHSLSLPCLSVFPVLDPELE